MDDNAGEQGGHDRRRQHRGRARQARPVAVQAEGDRRQTAMSGDSGLEAAASLAEETDAQVTLAYRGVAFQRSKPKNRDRIARAAEQDRLNVYLQTEVIELTEDQVQLNRDGVSGVIRNDVVIVCAGGVLPTDLLRTAGIRLETKWGEA